MTTPTLSAPTTRAAKPVKIKKWKRGTVSPGTYFALGLMVFLSAFPFYWMFVVASNGSDAISKIPPALIPGKTFPDVVNEINSMVPFWRAIFNTMFVATIISVLNVFFSALAGFALAKLRMPGKKQMLTFIIGTMMLPAQLGVIFMFMVMSWLNWINDFKALIVPAIVGAFGVFWMRQIVDSQIPNELLEAAKIDGASVFRTFMNIVVPAVLPASFVLGLFTFLGVWNDYLWPSLVLNDSNKYTVQVAITALNASYVVNYARNMAAALLGTAPLLILFIFVGRRLVAGVMDGAVKG
jgi:cellobiose transport system permease protein